MILASFLHNQTLIIVQAELQHNQETIKTNFSPDKNPAFYNYAHPIIRIMKSKSTDSATTGNALAYAVQCLLFYVLHGLTDLWRLKIKLSKISLILDAQSLFLTNARPEEVFKYFSKPSAFPRSVKAIAVLIRQGLNLEVWGHRPLLWYVKRISRFLVNPV